MTTPVDPQEPGTPPLGGIREWTDRICSYWPGEPAPSCRCMKPAVMHVMWLNTDGENSLCCAEHFDVAHGYRIQECKGFVSASKIGVRNLGQDLR